MFSSLEFTYLPLGNVEPEVSTGVLLHVSQLPGGVVDDQEERQHRDQLGQLQPRHLALYHELGGTHMHTDRLDITTTTFTLGQQEYHKCNLKKHSE